MKKFLVALQYWDGDRDKALGLLDLFHETVEENNSWADLVVFYRFDATPPPEELLKKLHHNFNKVWAIRGERHATGWPDGCNGLWYYLGMECFHRNWHTREWADYKSFLSIESDTCPLSDDWLRVISEEWDSHDVCVMGAWDSRNGDCPGLGHINGNGMFCIDIARRAGRPLLPPGGRGWDTWFAALFKELGWQGTYAIRNIWNHPTLSEDQFLRMKQDGAVFLHGIKDDSVRKLYLIHR
jgi:hypothetical protein